MLSVKFIFLSHSTKFSKNYIWEREREAIKFTVELTTHSKLTTRPFLFSFFKCLTHTSFPYHFPITHAPPPFLFSFFNFWKRNKKSKEQRTKIQYLDPLYISHHLLVITTHQLTLLSLFLENLHDILFFSNIIFLRTILIFFNHRKLMLRH